MAIQEDNVRVTFANMKQAVFHFRLENSEEFKFGDGTRVSIECGDYWLWNHPTVIDTHQDKRISVDMSAEEFAEWCSEWLRENYQVFMVERTVQL